MGIEIQKSSKKLLSSAGYIFKPVLSEYFGNPLLALVYNQLLYRAQKSKQKVDSELSVRFSYTRLAKMFGCSRKWIIEVMKRLQSKGAVKIVHSDRVNIFVINELKLDVEAIPSESASMIVFPELLKTIGPVNSILLQQIHIRQHKSGEPVMKSMSEWHKDVMMFVSLPTVIRTFKNLHELKLIHKEITVSDEGKISTYAVNYKEVAALLGIPYWGSTFKPGSSVSKIASGNKSW